MPELKEGLERLAGLTAPPDDAFDRLARKRNRMQRNRRIGAALLALAVAGAGVGAALVALGRSGIKPLPALRIRYGYGIQFPDGPLGYDKRGLAILDAATNLPDQTIVDLYFFSADVESPSRASVDGGRIPIRLSNELCHETERGLIGTTTKITVTVRAEFPFYGGGSRIGGPYGYSPPPPRLQPTPVQAALGPHFERLNGDQVRDENGERVLAASKVSQLPAATCRKKVVYTGGGDFRQVPVDQAAHVPAGPFPQGPFDSCPNPLGTLPVEAGDWATTGAVAETFDVALSKGDEAELRQLADPSVTSFKNWIATQSRHPILLTNVPSGYYLPAVPRGCGSLVALKTVGVTIARSQDEGPSVTYLLILRVGPPGAGGWKVWGELPGDGR